MSARILIVEDNPANLSLMTYLLKSFGHVPLAACDGAEGLEMVGRERPDLILCDLQLPKIDGYEVARRLKSDPELAKIPIVAVTAFAMVGDSDKVHAAGFDSYIPKPIVPRTFVQQVEAYLLPELHSTPKPDVPTAGGLNTSAGTRATVLVVDNSAVNITLARRILEPSGYQVVAAGSVNEGLALARQARPDLVLTDLHMPGADGLAFIKAAKTDPALQTIPIILISSSNWNDHDKNQALALGAARFVVRPIAPHKLLAEIESCLVREARR